MARDSELVVPACVYSPTGLAEFIFSGSWRADPEPGDIVFYTFATRTGEPFSMPHVGIVINTDAWKTAELFVAVEGDVDGSVVMVERWKFETLGFGRPAWKRWPAKGAKNADGPVFLNASRIRLGARGRDVMNVQLALRLIAGLRNETPGVFDATTQRAYARFQRLIGHVGADVDGIPTPATLAVLGERSNIFTINGATEN